MTYGELAEVYERLIGYADFIRDEAEISQDFIFQNAEFFDLSICYYYEFYYRGDVDTRTLKIPKDIIEILINEPRLVGEEAIRKHFQEMREFAKKLKIRKERRAARLKAVKQEKARRTTIEREMAEFMRLKEKYGIS